jgi:hypothetical protein
MIAMAVKSKLSDWLSVARLAALTLLCLTVIAKAQQPLTRTVRASAQGPTYDAAHDLAVRQALQQVVQQLVFADREVVNNTLVRDKIMSTMNGYVDSYHTLSRVHQQDGSWMIEEEFVISQSRISDFIGASAGSGAAVLGGLLQTDASREIAQRKARSEIFDRLLQPVPSRALELQFDSVILDERNPSLYIVGVKASLSKAWLNSFRDAMSTIAVDQFRELHGVGSPYLRPNPPKGLMYPRAHGQLQNPAASSRVCVIDDRDFQCFVLPPGHYGESTLMRGEKMSGAFDAPPIMLAIRFVDASGHSTIKGNKACLLKKMHGGPNDYGTRRLMGRIHGTGLLGRDYFIFGTTISGTVEVEASEVDMAASTRFAAVPFFAGRQYSGYVSLHYGDVRNPDDPGVLAISDISTLKVPQEDICGAILNDAMSARQHSKR